MMVSTWEAAIKKEILLQLRGQDAHKRFIGKITLLDIWKTVFQQPDQHAIHSDIFRVRGLLIDNHEDHTLLILASILIWIDFSDWHDFSNIFINGGGAAKYQLPLCEDDALNVLGAKGLNFCESQSIFLPKTISEGENLRFSYGDRLPFDERTCPTSAGVAGTVKKIIVARGYFRDQTGNINQKPRILARKRFHYPEEYEQEIKVLKAIRQNLRQHSHILAHMGTLAIGTDDFSILSEFADGGDLNQFLHGGFTGFKTHRDRILEEASNIADAIEFLHRSFHIDGEHRPCYHLDLKPANVLVFRRRNRSPELKDDVGEWMITDFGVSVLHERMTEGISRTSPRREPGTFQPPEIDDALGLPSVNAKGDVWSLGGILCMILAFLTDGKQSVEVLDYARSRTAAGRQDQDFFYVVQHQDNQARAILKPQIHRWLKEISDLNVDVRWAIGMVNIVRSCLNIDHKTRPDAASIHRQLMQMRKRPGPLPPLAIRTSQPSSPSPQLQAPKRSFFHKFKHRHTESQTALQTTSIDDSAEIRSAGVDQNAAHTPSTCSGTNYCLKVGPVASLLDNGNASCVCIESNGLHVVFCLSKKVVVHDLVPGSESEPKFVSNTRAVDGAFDTVYITGHYLALYSKSESKPTLRSLGMTADLSFANLADSLSTGLKTVISPSGDVIIMHTRKLRAARGPTMDYRIPAHLRKEIFQTVCFNRTGSRLFACGLKHWFVWKVDLKSPEWLQDPKIGNVTVSLDWKVADSSMFVFNNRNAFCLYDKRMRTLRLFDTDQNSDTQVTLDPTLLCAVIGSRDDQIFYVRLHDPGGGFMSRTRPTLGLYRRPFQGMKIGSEALLTELPNLEPRARFDMICQDEDSAQVLVIASTEGQYQYYRLESDEDVHRV